jgi:hypothetical protein
MSPNHTIAIIDVDIRSGQDEVAREAVLARLQAFEGDCVTPLWVNWLRARADLRVVCMVHELTKLDDFLIDILREAGLDLTKPEPVNDAFAALAAMIDELEVLLLG